MLVGAGEKLGKVLDTVEIHTPEIPYIANVTADYVTDAADVKPLLNEAGFFLRPLGADDPEDVSRRCGHIY